MKKSGCLVAFLLVAVCASMFVNLLLLAMIGTRGAAAMAGVKVLPQKEYEEVVLAEGEDSHSKIAGDSAGWRDRFRSQRESWPVDGGGFQSGSGAGGGGSPCEGGDCGNGLSRR
jgi:uncharacterized membrane protein YgcG